MSVGGQISKPRFFIDLLQYQYEIGNVSNISSEGYILGLSPTRSYESPIINDGSGYGYFEIGFTNPISIPSSNIFLAILGHSWGTDAYTFEVTLDDQTSETVTDIVNADCAYDGWSLVKFDPTIYDGITSIKIAISGISDNSTFKLGGIALGTIYEPEFHADLSVTQSRIMDGIKNKQTKGGKTYSVINYTKPPNWWTGSPFELTDPLNITPPLAFSNARIGRRSWDVGFSQLSDRIYTDGSPNGVFPANEMVNNHLTDTVNGSYSSDQDYDSESGEFNYNINNDNSLYSTVYHHTLGGTLPFLFSPSQDNSPQNFAICRFDKPGFKVTQKSYKKYNIKMKINESW